MSGRFSSCRNLSIKSAAAFAVVALAFVVYGMQLDRYLLSATQYILEPSHLRIRYPYLLETFRELVDAGIAYPRWIYKLYGGYGLATFLLYPPGYWYFSLPFTYIFSPITYAASASQFVCLLMIVAAYFRIARFFGNGTGASLFLMIIAVIFSTAANMTIISAALSSLFAYAFSLWGIYVLLLLQRRITTPAPYLGMVIMLCLVITAIIYIHPLAGAMHIALHATLAAGLALHMPQQQRMPLAIAATVCVAVAVLLSSPYWFVAWSLREELSLSHYLSVTPETGFRYLKHSSGFLFWHFGKYLPGLSLIPYGLAIGGLWILRHERWIWPVGLLYAAVLFMLTPYSLPLWQSLPGLEYFRPAGRFLLLSFLMEYLIYCAAAARLLRALPGKYFGTAFLALSILCLIIYRPVSPWDVPRKLDAIHKDYMAEKQRQESRLLMTLQTTSELVSTDRIIDAKHNRYARGIPLFAPESPMTGTALLAPDTLVPPLHAELRLGNNSVLPFSLKLNQHYMPGWMLQANATPLVFGMEEPDTGITWRMTEDGCMRLLFSRPGSYAIRAYYDGPPHWQARNSVILLATILLLAAYGWCYRREQSTRNPLHG